MARSDRLLNRAPTTCAAATGVDFAVQLQATSARSSQHAVAGVLDAGLALVQAPVLGYVTQRTLARARPASAALFASYFDR